jgi:hypothetical protein
MLSLFVGIESYNWTMKDFDKLIDFCNSNNVRSIVLKVYEHTQGEWYQDLGGSFYVIDYIQSKGIEVLPYGYFYGDENYFIEINSIQAYLSKCGKFCMNMETEFDGNDRITNFATGLKDHKGTLYCSTWANPVTHNWSKNIAVMDDIVDVWMPEVYDDNLLKEMYAQFPKVKGRIEPTFHVVDTYFLASTIYPNFSLWEYQLAQQYPTNISNYIEGKTMPTAPTNNKKMVANYREVPQFQPGKSEFECGAFAVSLNWRATAPDKTNVNNIASLIAYAEALYAMVTGSNGANNTAGVSIDDMHRMIKDTQKHPNGPPMLHYWDMPITANTKQADDIARIKTALQHGYPVIATVTESSIYDVDLKRNPYWWGPSGNHIITWVGIADDGNLLAVDPANVIQGDGNLQTKKTPQSWPRKYDIKNVQNTWATTVQMPWLPPIKDADPLKWPSYVPPMQPPPTPVEDGIKITYDKTSKQLIFYDGVTVIYRMQVQ